MRAYTTGPRKPNYHGQERVRLFSRPERPKLCDACDCAATGLRSVEAALFFSSLRFFIFFHRSRLHKSEAPGPQRTPRGDETATGWTCLRAELHTRGVKCGLHFPQLQLPAFGLGSRRLLGEDLSFVAMALHASVGSSQRRHTLGFAGVLLAFPGVMRHHGRDRFSER